MFCKGKYVLRYRTGCSSHAPSASSAVWTTQLLLFQLANIQCWPAGKSHFSPAPGYFIVYHHFSPVSPLPKSKVSSSPANLTAFTSSTFCSNSKPVEKFLSPIVEGSSVKPTALQFSLPVLITSGDGVFCEWDEKKSIDLLYRGFCLVSIIKYFVHEKIQNSKSPKLTEVFIERIQLRLQKKVCGKHQNWCCSCSLTSINRKVFVTLQSSFTWWDVLWCRRINMTKDLLYLEGVFDSVIDPTRSILGR